MPVRRSMKARAHIHKNDAGYYWFNILSANNRVVATSEIYTRKASAIKTAEQIVSKVIDKTGEKK